jgi:hypothetical protein
VCVTGAHALAELLRHGAEVQGAAGHHDGCLLGADGHRLQRLERIAVALMCDHDAVPILELLGSMELGWGIGAPFRAESMTSSGTSTAPTGKAGPSPSVRHRTASEARQGLRSS